MTLNMFAFLYMIRCAEGTSDINGYRRHFGGALIDSFDTHPHKIITKRSRGKTYRSSACGAYQFLSRTWDECAGALSLKDFSPQSQDLAAQYLVYRRGATADIEAGRFHAAVKRCCKEWASLPGSPYGQPVITFEKALKYYQAAGGTCTDSE